MTFTVAGYEIQQLIGSGSNGEVWRARRIRSGEVVALKRIPVGDYGAAQAARAEAALLGVFDHPHLIKFVEFLPGTDVVVLALELAEGGSLCELLRKRGTITPAEVAATLSPVAAALAYLHEEGVRHGDVSAANILFTASGHPKLADLGLARLLGSASEAIGTPAYVDPAVAAGGAPGPSSDLFSLAAVGLQALTGHGPWVGPSTSATASEPADPVEAVLARAAGGVIHDLDRRLGDCPPDFAAVLIRALDPQPHRRGSAVEFALDLRAATHSAPVVLRAGRTAARSVEPAGRSVGRHAVDRDRGGPRIPTDLTHIARRPAVVVSASAPSRGGRDGLGATRIARWAR